MWMPLETDSWEMKLNTAKLASKTNAPFRSLLKPLFIWFTWLHKNFVESNIKAKKPFRIMWKIEKWYLGPCSTEHPFRRKPFVFLVLHVSSAVIHYTVHLHLQSFCHALLLKEMERNPLDTSLAFFYQQASNSLIKSFPINYKLIVYEHFNTIFQMIVNKLWLVKRSDKDGGTGRGKGRGREVKQSRLTVRLRGIYKCRLALNDGWVSETSKPKECIMLT